MDRQHNNDRLRDIVQRHRKNDGWTPAIDIGPMVTELIALLDECVEEANADGFEEARQEG